MKKSIKYAGIAAATLLAVAPVAAPVVSQAADTATTQAKNADGSELTTAKTNFVNQFGNREDTDINLTDANDTTLALGSGNDTPLETFQKNNKDNGIIKSVTTDDKLTALTDQDANVYVTATDNKGTVYDGTIGKSVSDLRSAMALDNYMPVTFTVYLQYKGLDNGAYTSYAKATSFTVSKSDSDELKSINAKFTTPLNVAKNSKTAATQLVNGANLSLTDQNGDSVATKAIELGSTYYYTYTAAMNGNATTGVVSDSDIKDGEFKTAGTYYQRVTYTAQTGSSLASLIAAYQDDPSSYTIYVNGKNASEGSDFTTKTGDNTITFVRAIKVADSEAEWTVTENKGVVTTKADTPYYTLVNDDNAKITNRALAKNTAWVTDQKRVDQDGNTQYRVATGEWIDANNVTFSDKATTDEGAYTDEQALNGKVTLDGPSSFIYMLYNDNGENISNRALAGDSEWYTDKKATNAAGVTVYHVATGEWVQAGNGVNYSAY